MIRLDDALRSVTSLGFDTSPLIYFIEAHPRYDALVTDIFQRLTDGQFNGSTSVITLVEVLVMPKRLGDIDLEVQYLELFNLGQNFSVIVIEPEIAERAADIRARYHIKTPDALQVAAAIHNQCEAFLTNDLALRRVTEINILVLDELEL